MRLTILSSVSVLALLSLAPVPAFSAFEFVAPKPAQQQGGGITETKTAGPIIDAPMVESSHLPMPTTKTTASDLVKTAVNPAMETVDFGSQAIPLTPVVRESDALVIDTRAPTNRIKADVQELPPLPPMPSASSDTGRVAALPTPIMPTPAVPASVMPSSPSTSPYDDVPVSSFGVVPTVPDTIPVASAASRMNDGAGEVVQGFGRDVPLVLALQQIVPPSYRYSFDDGISPGMRISWSGGQPWKNVIMEVAQHNNMNVDIVSNVVAFHRGGTSSAPSAASSFAQPRSMLTAQEANDLPPVMPLPVLPPVADSNPQSILEPVRAEPIAPVMDAKPQQIVKTQSVTHTTKMASVSEKPAGFDPLLADDMPAKAKVENKKILTADASTAVKAIDETPSSFAMPMPITPNATVDAPKPVTSEMPRSSSENINPVPGSEIASAPSYVATDMATSREWQAGKGETLRQALTTWSSNAGVSLVWSSEYDYPLQTDVRIAGNYQDAVRTLLAGFSKAQPRPLGRLFDNQKAGAQPVLIVETQRLTD